MPRPASVVEPTLKADYLTFFIAGEEYGVPILRVREILEFGTLTRVPGAPACVRGVINLRGSVVPVADLAIAFGQPQCEITKLTCVVVVEVAIDGELAVMGLMVESVNQTVELSEADIEATPSFGTLARSEYLLGMGRVGKKFVLLLNVDRALSSEQLYLAHTQLNLPVDPAQAAESAQDG
jgi:purine-binding chemotaxis protein CheW